MTKIKDIIAYLENIAPPPYQEDYDNSGLLVGNPEDETNGVLIALDTTEEIIQEALDKQCNLVVSHHPIIFKGIKRLTGKNYVERTIISAVKNGVAIYAIHTNLDNISTGVNHKISQKLGLVNATILAPKMGTQSKLVSFVPVDETTAVLDALHKIGAGKIGNYDHCSFRTAGTGRYRPNERANPHIGTPLKMETTQEDRIEVIHPTHLQDLLVETLKRVHPYEEAAYYIHPVNNPDSEIGAGMIGDLPEPMSGEMFLHHLKNKMKLECIRHTQFPDSKIHKVAVCGGSGSFLLNQALKSGASAFVTADFKYHEFFNAEGKILLADIGHYESEAFTKELLGERLSQKFTSFALNLSERSTNPVRYF